MAGRNRAAAQAAFLLVLQIWESFIFEKYMKEACQYVAVPCPTCNSPRACRNYFCLQCKTGGLCPAVFRRDNEHCNHPWLQVRLYTRQYSVLSTDLARFISKDGLKHIHTNKLNGGERHCNLRSKQVAASRITPARVAGEKSCQGCMASIRGSKRSTETFLVCSLQCLVKVAGERSEWNLLAMNDGAMGRMEPPLFFTEKILKQRHMLETPTKTPVDEAPPPPQATGDSPMLETHEAPTEDPVVEAPPSLQATADSPMLETHEAPTEDPVVEACPLPQATGDFPMYETHEDLEVESILAALPFPLKVDDYPMFGTPAEASFGEALPFPPPTEDFPMFGTPAEASFGEALPVPPATEDFPMFENTEAPPAPVKTQSNLRLSLSHLDFKPLTSAPSGQRRCGSRD